MMRLTSCTWLNLRFSEECFGRKRNTSVWAPIFIETSDSIGTFKGGKLPLLNSAQQRRQ